MAADGMFSHRILDMNKDIMNHSFLMTDDGRMGSGPLGAAEGDWVVVLNGMRIPVVLREVPTRILAGDSNDSCYQFVGTAYVHGVMDGEAVDIASTGAASEETFILV